MTKNLSQPGLVNARILRKPDFLLALESRSTLSFIVSTAPDT